MIPTPPADQFAAIWRKSTRSAGGSSNCVEVARLPNLVAIRDSKDPEGGMLVIDRAVFQHLLNDLRHGTFTS
jgi:Domain of unknown function (DUF397)